MSSGYTGQAAGGLTIQKYNNFRGVDFTDSKVAETRSPDALNMWKDYKTLGKKIETRPEIELLLSLSNTIHGLFFYTINNVDHWIIHCGTSLYDYNPSTEVKTTIKETGMNPAKSSGFIYNNIFYIIDGINYLEYNGEMLKTVDGYVPTIAIHNYNTGSHKTFQDRNMISDYAKEIFFGDGTTTEYQLTTKDISEVTVWIDEIQQATGYTADTTNGIITFTTAPTKDTDSANVTIRYKKPIAGYKNKIFNCTLTAIFDKRVFFSGNQDYPNAIFWCGLEDPRYISDKYYANDGDLSKIRALVPGNNALWVFKEPSQSNTTVFYHVPGLQYNEALEQSIKTYAETHSSITTGCKATGINFNDDIVFFSDRGMEGISGDITTEQILGHRSTLVDRKLLNEANYSNMVLTEHEGYLMVIIDSHVYLADSRQKVNNNDHAEYEWFYWELSKDINIATEHNGVLYLGSKVKDSVSGIYTLTNKADGRTINSYWTTPEDDFNYPQMLKSTNKKGFKSDVSGTDIEIEVKTDTNNFKVLGTFSNTKGYIVTKIKEKKWNDIQLKYSCTKPFGIYGITLESYIGSYVKR